MDIRQLKSIGTLLAILAVILASGRFYISLVNEGPINWYYLFMASGMILVLFYTFFRKKS